MSWLRSQFARIERHKLLFAILSVVITLIVMVAFLIENRWGYMKPDPILIYAASWEEGRSVEDALADRAREEEARRLAEEEAARLAAEAEAEAKTEAKAEAEVVAKVE